MVLGITRHDATKVKLAFALVNKPSPAAAGSSTEMPPFVIDLSSGTDDENEANSASARSKLLPASAVSRTGGTPSSASERISSTDDESGTDLETARGATLGNKLPAT